MESKKYIATFSIYDAATGIKVEDFKVEGRNNSAYRAKHTLQRSVERVLQLRTRKWVAESYGLTALQLRRLMKDGVISSELNFYKVKFEKIVETVDDLYAEYDW